MGLPDAGQGLRWAGLFEYVVGSADCGQGLRGAGLAGCESYRVRGRACDGQGFYWRDRVALGAMLVVCSRLSDLTESDAFLDVLGVLVSW